MRRCPGMSSDPARRLCANPLADQKYLALEMAGARVPASARREDSGQSGLIDFIRPSCASYLPRRRVQTNASASLGGKFATSVEVGVTSAELRSSSTSGRVWPRPPDEQRQILDWNWGDPFEPGSECERSKWRNRSADH